MFADGVTGSGKGSGTDDEFGEEGESIGSGDSIEGCCDIREEG